MKKILIFIGLLFITVNLFSQERQRERYYQMVFGDMMNGRIEVVLSDRTRVDILTDSHAIEVDFAENWAQSIGQALHYEGMTGKKAGVLLIMKGYEEERFLERLMGVAAKHGIDVWVWNYTNDTYKKVEYSLLYNY